MSDIQPAFGDQHKTGLYEIRVKGHLDPRWADWFEGLNLVPASDGTTVLAGPVVDQAALHGVLRKVRDLGLPLVSVMVIEPGHPAGSTNNADSAIRISNKETDS